MDFQELAAARYSLRKFSDHPVEPEILETVLRAGLAAPTAHNNQPQHVFVLRSQEAREKAKSCTPYTFGAPVLLVVTYDSKKSWHRELDGKDHGEIDAAITAAHLMLQAADLGLGTTYVGVFDPVKLAELFPETADYTPIAILPLGYPAESAHPARLHGERKPLSEFCTEL